MVDLSNILNYHIIVKYFATISDLYSMLIKIRSLASHANVYHIRNSAYPKVTGYANRVCRTGVN